MELNRFVSPEGICKARLTFEITFYIHSADSDIAGLTQAYETILGMITAHAKWYRTERMTRYHLIDKEALRALPFWFSSKATKRSRYGIRFESGETADTVGHWAFIFHFFSDSSGELSGYFHLSLPCGNSAINPSRLSDVAIQLADQLPFHSGHAGFGIHTDEDEDDPARDQWCYAMCRRFWCVDARDLLGTLEILPDCIKGVSWITFLDHKLSARIGTVDYLREVLGGEYNVAETANGIGIVVGRHPILGDANASQDIILYKKICELTRSIRTLSHPCIPGFTGETTLEWIERFD